MIPIQAGDVYKTNIQWDFTITSIQPFSGKWSNGEKSALEYGFIQEMVSRKIYLLKNNKNKNFETLYNKLYDQ